MNRLLSIHESLPIVDCVRAISARINNSLDESKLPHMFVPEKRWKESPEKAPTAYIITALQPPSLRSAVKTQVECEGAGKDPGEFITIMTLLKTEWQITEKYEAGRQEPNGKSADEGDARQDSQQQRAQGCCGGYSKPTIRVSGGGCWPWGGLHLKVHCPQWSGGKQQDCGGGGKDHPRVETLVGS